MQKVVKYAFAVGALLGVSAVSLLATPTPLESAVTELTGTASDITAEVVTVVTASLGLFAIAFGIRWLIRLFKGTAK